MHADMKSNKQQHAKLAGASAKTGGKGKTGASGKP
jgi:hypothetical protein